MTSYAKDLPAGASNHIRNVAIVGVTGTIGSQITTELLKTGQHKVTAISREGSSSTAPAGVVTKYINYNEHASIVDALRGQDILIISLSVTAPRDTQSKLIAAAKDAGLEWIMPNAWGYSFDSVDDQFGQDIGLGPGIAKTKALITESGLSSVSLYSGFWEDFSFAGGDSCYGFDFAGRAFTQIDDGEQKFVSSTLPFCGLAVARLLSLPILPQDKDDKSTTISQWRNDSLYVGSHYLNQNERFDAVLRVTGTKKSDWKITQVNSKERFDDATAKMMKGDHGAFVTKMYTRIFYKSADGDFKDKLQNDLLGLSMLDVDELVRDSIKIAEQGRSGY